MQTFCGQRLMMASERITGAIMAGSVIPDFQNFGAHDYEQAIPGAPGGSMLISPALLAEVGGWDDCFFTGYSVEDQFMFNKLKLSRKLFFANSPRIEQIHLHHTGHHRDQTRYSDFVALDLLNAATDAEKWEYIRMRANKLHETGVLLTGA
jgi:hypothetical protein